MHTQFTQRALATSKWFVVNTSASSLHKNKPKKTKQLGLIWHGPIVFCVFLVLIFNFFLGFPSAYLYSSFNANKSEYFHWWHQNSWCLYRLVILILCISRLNIYHHYQGDSPGLELCMINQICWTANIYPSYWFIYVCKIISHGFNIYDQQLYGVQVQVTFSVLHYLCTGHLGQVLGHPFQLEQHGLHVVLLTQRLRSLRAARILG